MRFSPSFDSNGEVKSVSATATSTFPSTEKGGAVAKITFRLPKRLFGPIADLTIEFDEDSLDRTPQIMAADLKTMRDSL